MRSISKHNIYLEPEGYFESLPDRVVHRIKTKNQRLMFIRVAAAAVLLIGLVLFIFKPPTINEATLQALWDQEVELYISSGYWDAEDVLLFSEDPDELLDVIIAEEWSDYSINEDQFEDEFEY